MFLAAVTFGFAKSDPIMSGIIERMLPELRAMGIEMSVDDSETNGYSFLFPREELLKRDSDSFGPQKDGFMLVFTENEPKVNEYGTMRWPFPHSRKGEGSDPWTTTEIRYEITPFYVAKLFVYKGVQCKSDVPRRVVMAFLDACELSRQHFLWLQGNK